MNLAKALEDLRANPFETVFVVGTGVIAGGWAPLNAAVWKVEGRDEPRVNPIEPIAHLIFLLRTCCLKDTLKYGPIYEKTLGKLDRIRKEIAHAFEEATRAKRLKLRISGSNDYVNTFGRGRCLILTTNWDTLVGDYYDSKHSVAYLHGSVKEHSGIYLPTEMCIEPYRDEYDPGFRHLLQIHRFAVEALEHAAVPPKVVRVAI